MKKITTFTGRFILVFLVSLIFNSCTQGPMDVTSEIMEANKKFMEAFNSQDAEAVASHYTENGSLFPPNSEVITGHEAITSFWNGPMSMGIERTELETITAESFGDFAIEEGLYRLFDQGDIMIDHGKYFVTWEKVGGEWKLDKDIWNTSNPAIPRAMENDTIWFLTSRVKPENFDRMMDFAMNYAHPAFEEYFPGIEAKTRFFRDLKPDKDGYLLVHYLVDPYSSSDIHNVKPILEKKYDEEEVERLMKEFSETIVDQTQIMAVQMEW